MCGFVGLLQRDGEAVSEGLIKRMSDTIVHRGPDEEGIFIDRHMGFGFRRLSIIDLEGGTQPFTNEDKTIWLVFNGEIYNYKEIRTWLAEKGHQFKTDSEAETLIHLYQEVGFDTPKHLRGMFAFMIWDKEKDLLFGARDHFGIKPLYWTQTENRYAFASEIKSLVELDDVERTVNKKALYHYLTFQYVPEPDTMFAGVHKTPPAHYFILQNDELKIEKYWDVEFTPDENRPFEDFVEETREAMKDTVKHHLMSDVPRGAFLSSGVDSSSIVALHRQHENVQSFTVGFDIPGYSEQDFARRTSEALGSQHKDIKISSDRYLEELPRLIWHQDEPVADPSAIALYFVSELASQHVTVALSGEGADEFFGGYNIYCEPNALQMFSHLPNSARKWIGKVATRLPQVKGKNYLIRGSKVVEERYFGNALIFDEVLKPSVLAEGMAEHYASPWEVTHPIFDRIPEYDDVTKMQYLDIHTWLRGNILMKADKMSMANSLELRVPFTDIRVFETAAKIPVKYKIANGTTKHVLREAMKDMLPDEISGKKKLGFPVPTRHWLRNDFYEWAWELVQESETDHLFNKDFIRYMLEEHKEGRTDFSRRIWTILCFMLWHQIYIEKKHSFSTPERSDVQRHRFFADSSETVYA
ncbi:asparagine synthase (glutamine-hydrolyzing) [Mechercharimyces sp. CAU 1602]|uniref:asparagine synthase (glutamine-hydrolyzing) n=1 Tax=Mechercharimyces sp. CAU 1602 TaxID=2973933 RepID=UPI002162202E|nr:asparagine synthase (glutamine-hydrolyzing) [Mechercharimyces sp. CAU 1602]MCS1351647.1 asparagine synthase (glutamine-hydrolyzing) [Mechercharimyces sp. CAU 1602]